MKTTPILMTSILLLAISGGASADPEKRNTVIRKREAQQQEPIQQGVKAGEPAKKEAKEKETPAQKPDAPRR